MSAFPSGDSPRPTHAGPSSDSVTSLWGRSMKSTLVAAACVLTGLAACDLGRENVEAEADAPTLSGVQMRSAEQDANAALARGDTRLIGVFGFAREVPGAPAVSAYEAGGCVRMIEGTNDYENSWANKRAREYARRYNAQMLKAVGRMRGGPVESVSC